MRLSLDAAEQAVVDAFAGFFSTEAPPSRVRDAEPLGHDPRLWRSLLQVGGPCVALDPAVGGGGGSLVDAALVAEQYGRRVAPAPLVEPSAALRLLERCGPVGHRAIARVLDDGCVLSMALRPGTGGTLALTPWGAVADLIVAIEGNSLVLVEPGPVTAQLGLGAPALGNVALEDATDISELASGDEALAWFHHALDEWRALQAAVLVGVAGEALDLAVAYVKDRHQFGRPVGSFQALAHGLADAATAVDGARLLALEASWALGTGASDGSSLASMAVVFAAHTAPRTTAYALHCHGGYGFMQEYDVQLYHRRAKSWSLLHHTRAGELAHLADTLWGD